MARTWVAQKHQVFAVTRSRARALDFARDSITPLVADITHPLEERLGDFDSVFFAVGFDRGGRQSLRDVYVGGLANVLQALAVAPPRRLIYISSTGVYGDHEGEWITEETPSRPEREGGTACLEAEMILRNSPWLERSVVLRLAGIYGPGRLPNRQALLSGAPIAAAETGFLNLIHVEDAAAAVDLAISAGLAGRIYNVSDGSPVVRGDYYREVARQVGAPPPRFESAAANARTQRASADKRVSNERIVRELGFQPTFATYREGIAASLLKEQSST